MKVAIYRKIYKSFYELRDYTNLLVMIKKKLLRSEMWCCANCYKKHGRVIKRRSKAESLKKIVSTTGKNGQVDELKPVLENSSFENWFNGIIPPTAPNSTSFCVVVCCLCCCVLLVGLCGIISELKYKSIIFLTKDFERRYFFVVIRR